MTWCLNSIVFELVGYKVITKMVQFMRIQLQWFSLLCALGNTRPFNKNQLFLGFFRTYTPECLVVKIEPLLLERAIPWEEQIIPKQEDNWNYGMSFNKKHIILLAWQHHAWHWIIHRKLSPTACLGNSYPTPICHRLQSKHQKLRIFQKQMLHPLLVRAMHLLKRVNQSPYPTILYGPINACLTSCTRIL